MIQIIVYSAATGRVRRVIDPQVEVDVEAFQRSVNLSPGEVSVAYTKRGRDAQGNSLDTLPHWQALISAHTGLTPDKDRYCSVDPTVAVVAVHIADPLCGDTSPHPNCALVQHDSAAVGDSLS